MCRKFWHNVLASERHTAHTHITHRRWDLPTLLRHNVHGSVYLKPNTTFSGRLTPQAEEHTLAWSDPSQAGGPLPQGSYYG